MRGNERSITGWIRWLLAVSLCAALASRSYGADPPHGADEEDAWAEPDQTWLNPDEADTCESEGSGPGVAGWLAHGLPHYRARHIGLGLPLTGTSWLNRPMYVGGFLGATFGSTLLANDVEVQPSTFGGLWLGCDLNHYWGSEFRLGLNYASVEYAPDGYTIGNSRNTMADVNLLYYPWGDSRCRPYAIAGIGFSGYHFDDDPDLAVDHAGFALPLGFGMKCLWGKQLALRLDVKDNLVFGGNGVQTTHNVSLTAGIEFHWGSGSAAQYYPW